MTTFPDFRRCARITAIVLLSATVIAGCGKKRTGGKSGADGGPPVDGDWVVIHDSQDAENFNPVTTTDAAGSEVDGYIYESLTNTNPFTLATIPWISDSLPKESPDHLSYEFRIKKDVTFSDGHPVTAKDFILFLKAVKNPLIINAAPLRGYYSKVKSAEMIENDPMRLRVVMAEPYFLGDQWAGGLTAYPAHIWDPKNLNDKITFEQLNKADSTNPAIREFADFVQDIEKGKSKAFLIGSGPYKFEEWRRNEKITLVRNEKYWNKQDSLGKAYPDKLIWRTIADMNAAVVSLKSGDLDVMPGMPKVNYVKEKPKFEANNLSPAEYDYPSYNYFGFNMTKPLFKDKLVRNALARAVDRDNIIKNILFGMARPVQSPLFYKRPECDTTLPIIKYDLDAAKKMLSDAGWKDTDGDGILDKMIDGKKTDFRVNILISQGSPVGPQIAVIFTESLGKIGIEAKTTTLEWSTFLKRTREGDYDIMMGGWAMGVQEGDLFQIWHSKSISQGGSNHVHYSNPEVDKLIEQVQSEFDQQKRFPLVKQIQKIIYDDQPYIFLVSSKTTGAYSSRFEHVQWFAPRPCYNPGWWWVSKSAQKYKAAKEVAAN